MKVGATDLFYKLNHGHHDYANASAIVWGPTKSTISFNSLGWSLGLTRSQCEDVLAPYHATPAPGWRSAAGPGGCVANVSRCEAS